MRSIEFLIILAVAAFDLAVVSWRVGLDQLVKDAKLLAGLFKQRKAICSI